MTRRKSSSEKSRAPEISRTQVGFYCAMAVLALVGLTDSSYLTIIHLTGEDAACGPGGGCSVVLGSAYATIGGIPTAALGLAAYFAAFSCATLAAFAYTRARLFLMLLVTLMFAASLGFLCLQTFVLHAFCPFCLLSAALSFLLAGLALVVPRSP